MTALEPGWWKTSASTLLIGALAICVGVSLDSLAAFLVGFLAVCVLIAVEGVAIYQEILAEVDRQ